MLKKLAVGVVIIAVLWSLISIRKTLVKDKLESEYDYVIVGAGSAGSILAARLSEDPGVNVAVLEAGADNDDFPDTKIPMSWSFLQGTEADWQYKTEPQQHACAAIGDKKSRWARGRALGGSSLINVMAVVRGDRHDYDRWAEMGNSGWSWDDVLPYFKKLESFTYDEWAESGMRGKDGPITVERSNIYPNLTKSALEAAELNGFRVKDINDGDSVNAIGPEQRNVGIDGVRHDTASRYLKPAMTRNNLHVITRAHVMKVLFENRKAVGVEYMHKGHKQVVRARKEVILSAGTIGSPQILMLSGVGPKHHLQQFNIPVVADLPVGRNMKDHIMTDAIIYSVSEGNGFVPEHIGLMDVLQYKLFGTGILASSTTVVIGFTRTSQQPADRQEPDIQYMLLSGHMNDAAGKGGQLFHIQKEVIDTLYAGLTGKDAFVLFPVLLHPSSTGYIELRSSDPFEHPIIQPNYLTEQKDIKVLIEGIRKGVKMMESEPMARVDARRLTYPHPNCVNETYDSDSYWECYIRSNTVALWHATSTCKMGPEGCPTAVVDAQLRVHGVQSLRVVDASVMPDMVSGNTNFPIMMIAERAADIIKGTL